MVQEKLETIKQLISRGEKGTDLNEKIDNVIDRLEFLLAVKPNLYTYCCNIVKELRAATGFVDNNQPENACECIDRAKDICGLFDSPDAGSSASTRTLIPIKNLIDMADQFQALLISAKSATNSVMSNISSGSPIDLGATASFIQNLRQVISAISTLENAGLNQYLETIVHQSLWRMSTTFTNDIMPGPVLDMKVAENCTWVVGIKCSMRTIATVLNTSYCSIDEDANKRLDNLVEQADELFN